MTLQSSAPPATSTHRPKLIGGGLLILIGLTALARTWLSLDDLTFPLTLTLGLLLIAWGIAARQSVLLIFGSIQTGIGLGVLASQFASSLAASDARAGLWLLGFSLGWLLITPLTTWFSDKPERGAERVAGVLAAVGGLLLLGLTVDQIIRFARNWWPALLILVGAHLIWRRPAE